MCLALCSHQKFQHHLLEQVAQAHEFHERYDERGSICITGRKLKGVSNVLGAQGEDE